VDAEMVFFTQLELPYYKWWFKIIANTSHGPGVSKLLQLDCSATVDY